MTIQLNIVPFLLHVLLTTATGLNCTDNYYHGVPKNVTTASCNPEGRSIELECQIYTSIAPNDPNSNISIMWYRSATVEQARKSGELIIAKQRKYEFSESRASSPVNDSSIIINGLFFIDFNLRIFNFDSRVDNGYYWCQMVINETRCLKPSDFGRVQLNPSNQSACSFGAFDFVKFEKPQVCAESSQCTTQVARAPSDGETTTQSDAASTTFETTTSLDISTTVSVQVSALSMAMLAILYAAIGILLFIIVILLLVVAAFSLYTVRNRKTFVTLQRDTRESEMGTIPRQYYNIYDQSNYPQPTNEQPPDQPQNGSPPPPSIPPPHQPGSDDGVENDESAHTGEDGHYAYPNQHYNVLISRLREQEGTGVPPITTTGQYQDLRFSRLDYTQVYTVTNAKRTGNESRQQATPKYENIPNST